MYFAILLYRSTWFLFQRWEFFSSFFLYTFLECRCPFLTSEYQVPFFFVYSQQFRYQSCGFVPISGDKINPQDNNRFPDLVLGTYSPMDFFLQPYRDRIKDLNVCFCSTDGLRFFLFSGRIMSPYLETPLKSRVIR